MADIDFDSDGTEELRLDGPVPWAANTGYAVLDEYLVQLGAANPDMVFTPRMQAVLANWFGTHVLCLWTRFVSAGVLASHCFCPLSSRVFVV